jgi:DNA-binding CsgD family transcriptional regulator
MLVAIVRRLREAKTLPTIAQVVGEELVALAGVRTAALVLCDADGTPRCWLGPAHVERETVRTYLAAPDAMLARVCKTYVPERAGEIWLGPLHGADRVIGALRVTLERDADRGALAIIAACISIRVALLGLADTHPPFALTPRQREIAELVSHGCTNPEIAKMLAISANAVKKHVSRVLVAVDVSNRTELAAVTARWRIPSGNHQVLPPSVQIVVRNPPKPISAVEPDECA